MCPSLVTVSENVEETPENVTTEIVQLMNRADLDVRNEDVDDLIASHSEPLTNDELIEIQDANTINTEDNVICMRPLYT